MKALLQKIRRILKDRRTRQMLTRIISVTAAVVVFVTTYALVLPAITMETEAQCGIEAHQHSDECYTDELVCEIPESLGHLHTDACYELSQVLVCEKPEHEHSVENGCYDEDGNLICELSEHHHTVNDGCYKEVKELVCDIPESEGHTHDSSCYKKVLTCGKEVHTHSTACYHIDAASRAATEAAAVASTESVAIAGTESMMSTKASTASEVTAFADNLPGDEIDESNIGTIGTATSADTENADTTSADANAAGADLGVESGTWTPAEETVDSTATETDSGATGSTTSAAPSSATSSTSSTASTTENATEENAGYVPVLDELNINTVLNDHTGIYYYHPESDSAVESSEISTEDSDGTVPADNNDNNITADNNDDTASAVIDGTAIPAEDWHRIPNNTEYGETPELEERDLLRVYLAYTIPAGSLNETNTVARYRLPGNIRLSDDQIDTINSTVNGIAAQYVNMDTLEILDVDQYNASLGIEAVEGTRTPDQTIQDYLNDLEKSGKEASEYINATVRVENIFNKDSGDYEGQDLVFTFTPYSILKNQHVYDKDGQPTKAGEELLGWLSLDLTTDQIEWSTTENGDDNDEKEAVEKAASIVFVESDKGLGIDEISTELKLFEKPAADDIPTEKTEGVGAVDTAETTEGNETEAARDEEKVDNKAEATEDDEIADNEKAVEELAVNYPSASFDDSITVTSGSLSTDTTGVGVEENTEITLHVEADGDTFPEGTTMRLAAVTADQMDAVTEAVEGAMAEAAGTQGTSGRTQGFHALDISFWNADGIEIEPLKPIRVSMTSEAIKRAVEDSSTAPVVVHVEDGHVADHAADTGNSVEKNATSEGSVAESADDNQDASTSSDSETVDNPESGLQTLPTASIIETEAGETKEENTDTLTFEAGAFSVYAIVYTVDFHYEVNGKMYEFSIPGGSFVSFYNLVEVLGIARIGENTADSAENEVIEGDNTSESDVYNGVEEPGVEDNGENGSNYEENINLNNVEVSEATKKFVADVANVEFSSPELVWVGKVNEATTVGGLKEANALEVQYSAELTEEQIEKINSSTVEAGDWALISVLPFDTEESLTVTMKNGDQWTVKVTDAQPADTDTNWYSAYGDFGRGNTNRFVIWGVGSDGKNYVLKTDGMTEEFDPNTIDTLGAEYLWTIEYGWNNGWDNGMDNWDIRYYIRPANDSTKCLALNNGYIAGENLVQSESSGTHLYAPYSRHKNQGDNNYTNNNAGWILEGWGWTRLNLGNSSHDFEGHQQYCSNINISRVQTPLTYDIIVRTDNYDRGAVSGKDKGGTNRQAAESFTATTENTYNVTKRNRNEISAEPQTSQWMFDYWDLDGQTLYWDRYQRRIVFEENSNTEIYTNLNDDRASIINAYSLPVSFNGTTLTAHFKRNPDYVVPDDDKDGRPIDATIAEWLEKLLDADFPLNKSATQKTAEVYDYENRIYRVDITASSNLYALEKNVKLGFILDVSGSMKFPSQLDMVSNSNNTQTTTVKENQLKLELNKINENRSNRENWLNRNKTYYMIADVTGTATVNRIFYDWGSNKWKFVDSSKGNSSATEISTSTLFHSSGDTGGNYPIYMAGDPITEADLTSEEGTLLTDVLGLTVGDPKPRAFYLQRSMRETTATLQQIMDKVSVANNPNDASEVLIAWNTFCKTVNGSDHTFKAPANVEFNYTYSGGTSTDRALNDALSFGWGHDSDASRFAVLITDGAPQRDGIYVPDTTVGGYAGTLRNNGTPSNTADDITLITLGLSMGDVHRGEVLLYDIASKDKENVPYYYEAESGNELELALAEVIRLAMANAITEGNVTDTVNEAFYPVDKLTGLPIENGYVINLDGELIAFKESDLTPSQKSAGYGVVSESNGTYSVTWTGQEFTWEGWHGTIYEKAKEDFLGGNAVRTNDPDHPAVVTSTGYKLHSGDTAIPFKNSIKTAGTKSLETPRVSVNELQIEGNNSEWTVYLGTSVDPLEQIKELYKNIKVQQVITNGSDTDRDSFKDKEKWDWNSPDYENFPLYYDLVESASDDRENETYGQQEFFYLSNLIKKLNGGNDINWTQLIELSEKTGDQNTGITFPYDLYGQDNPGWITIKLEKDHSTDSHVTAQVGTPVETYTLTAFFSPLYDHTPVGLGGDGLYPYHTGNYGLGTYGNAPGTEDVSNEHKINVFAKKLSITKVDQANTAIKNSNAEFKLYRKAQTGETPLDSAGVPSVLPAGSYILADTLTIDADGKAVTNIDISRLPNDEPYYLVETKTPAGYISLPGALEVKAEIDNEVWTKVADPTQPLTSSTKWNPYVLSNWNHDATIIVSGTDELANYAVREGNIIYDQTQDGVNYMIRNNAGVELPATGGPGTTLIYLFGIMLTGLANAGLVMRRKRKAA